MLRHYQIFKKSRAVAESLIDLYAVMRLLPEEDKIVFFVPEIEGDPELAVTPTGINVAIQLLCNLNSFHTTRYSR